MLGQLLYKKSPTFEVVVHRIHQMAAVGTEPSEGRLAQSYPGKVAHSEPIPHHSRRRPCPRYCQGTCPCCLEVRLSVVTPRDLGLPSS